MSDLNRKQFEAWQSKETPGADLEHCGELIGNGPARVSYRNMYVAERWIGWQASRECLVIDLPIIQECCSDGGESSKWMAPEDVIKSIHAAGVKYK